MGGRKRGGSGIVGSRPPWSLRCCSASATPLAKLLLGSVSPWLLAALLYLGSGVGMTIFRLLRHARGGIAKVPRADLPWLVAAILSGGVIGPVLLMFGLAAMPASGHPCC